ncbi:Ig-like domain-containing protein [Taibaiella helva]|uniref:Ig-like domain-containing protein n=1 Tax=Taibaiella helva TaxID=2301235 RepID=UPI000E58F623|nr:PKD domain-containing protein [Taibaiella helva]
MNKNLSFKRITSSLLTQLLLLGWSSVYAQIPASSYSHTAVAGTFTDITGTTGATVLPSSFLGDDVSSAALPIGFIFNYCGIGYTDVVACTNGWLSFNAATTSTAYGNTLSNLTGSGASDVKPALMPLWDDHRGNADSAATAAYVTTGTAPNRVFIIQWKNWQWYRLGAVNISYQVKLYESTNVIEFCYRQEANGGNPSGASGATIGIADGAATPTYLTLNNASAAATASSTTFTTDISTRPATGQIFRFTPPPACNTITSWPAATAATAAPTTICSIGGTVSLNVVAALPVATGLTYQWEWSVNGTLGWTNIGPVLTTPLYTASNITSSRYFRCKVLCNGGATPIWVSDNTPQVVVTDPGSPVAINGTRCGPGMVTLAVTPPAGSAGIRWYQDATGGAPLATGSSYTTGYLTQNTTYYAVAASAATGITAGRPAPQGSSTGLSFSVNYGMIFDAAQPFTIQSVEVYPTSTTAGSTYVLLKNSAGVTLQTAGPFALPIGTGTTVAGGATPAVLPLNFNVSPGTGYRLVDSARTGSIIRDNPISGWSYPLPIGTVGNITAGLGGGSINSSAHYYFYNWQVSATCEGPRVPVTATINASTPVVRTFPEVICNNSVGAIALTPPSPPYSGYSWSPQTNLYTDAAGTVPYTGGSAQTIYLKTSTAGPQIYYLMAGNPASATGCTFADTVTLWVQPGNVAIKGLPDTICTSGATTLSLAPIAGYAPGAIQWQDSIPGASTGYADIGGATGPGYTTPSLSFGQNRYYRALIRAGSSVCENPVKYIVVTNPTIISTTDSFHCGPGHVSLAAVTGGNSTPVWYDAPAGGTPVGTGATFVTPYLGATTNYYVTANGGGASGDITIGTGAATATGYVSPFHHAYGGQKNQYLILAAELLASGIPAGARITSVGLDVVISGFTYKSFAVSAGQTTANVLTTTWQPNMTEVRAAADVTTTAGVNTLTFDNPYTWDGTSNLVIQTCYSNNNSGGTSNSVRYDILSYAATAYQRTDGVTPATICGNTSVYGTLSQRPKFIIGYNNRCEPARRLVVASIYPKPVVDLGPDINKCIDAGEATVLDAGLQPDTPQYRWDNGSASRVRAVVETGRYHVTVTNQYTCATSDTINVTLRKNPVVNLGNDTSVCNGTALSLDAGNGGVSYFWSNGSTGQMLDVNTAGTYNVFVTNNLGCIKSDTIIVNMSGELPAIDGINISNNGVNTFRFTAMNPQNVIGYEWDFGDGSPHSFQQSPVHAYAMGQANYTVVLRMSSSCGFVIDSTSAHIVGINQLNVSNDEMTVFPNPAKSTATILNKSSLKMEKVEVYNVLGQIVYRAAADSRDKHMLTLGSMGPGVYTIRVYTDKGAVARKLELLK